MNATVTKTLKFTGKCTVCNLYFELTKENLNEARSVGCAISPCCGDVATIEKVEYRSGRAERGGINVREWT